MEPKADYRAPVLDRVGKHRDKRQHLVLGFFESLPPLRIGFFDALFQSSTRIQPLFIWLKKRTWPFGWVSSLGGY